MNGFERLFANNRKWAESMTAMDSAFFEHLAAQQSPEYLWIGCADSRVPANEIVGLLPGEVFVHRNVANQVILTDFNCLSVVQYAIEVLRVRHVLVCGHYGCGGVKAAFKGLQLGLIDNWLHTIGLIGKKYGHELASIPDDTDKVDRLCELNVIEQVRSLCATSLIRNAWTRGQEFDVNGVIYGLNDGILHDLNVTIRSKNEIQAVCDGAAASLFQQPNKVLAANFQANLAANDI